MDGESVTDEPSDTDQPRTFTQLFRAVFPAYLAMGMTYEEFWNGPVWLVESYREAYEMRLENEEIARHRQGMYFFQALKVAMQGFSKDRSHIEKYPDRPWPITQKAAQEREEQDYRNYIARMRANSDRERQRINGEEAIKDGEY